MRAQLAAEMLKLRSTRTTVGLFASMVGLVVTAVVLHGSGLPADRLESPPDQLTFLIGWGEVLGALFAGLAGALAITGEIRHGTIRPTLLATPRRERVVIAKALAGSLVGLVIGTMGTSVAVATGRIVLAIRGFDAALDGADYALLIAGGAAAGALWAVIGLGVGAIVRNQVPTVVGLLAWLLFVEGILLDNAPGVGRFAPGALGQAMSGLHPDTLLAPAVGVVLLAVYATTALAAGTAGTLRRDIE